MKGAINMSNRVQQVRLSPPVSLGEPVTVRIGQAAAFLQREDGATELYMVSNGSPAVFYTVELPSGRVAFQYEISGAHAVWGMTTLHNVVYFCATDDGILYRYLPEERRVELVGDFPSGSFVWDMAASADGKVYGATYPEAQLFEYDPQLNQFRDLGQMSSDQHYVRGTASVGDYLFAGIGSEIHFMQYDRRTGEKKELIVEGYTGEKGFISRIFPSSRKNLLFLFAGGTNALLYDYKQQIIVDQFKANSYISQPSPYTGEHIFVAGPELYTYCLESHKASKLCDLPVYEGELLIKSMKWLKENDGSYSLAIVSTNMDVVLYRPSDNSCIECPIDIPATPVAIQSLEWDGKDKLYLGGYHRGLAVYDTKKQQVELSLKTFPQIEGIGFDGDVVYFGTYTKANIYRYDPSIEERPSYLFQVGHHQDRPFAVRSGDRKVFFGTIADYGLLTGALAMYDTVTGKHETYPNVVPNQSIIGLAYRDGLIYGGTTNWGGLGIEAIETEAKLFVWDVEKRELLHSFTPDIPGIDIQPRMIGELRFGPDGLLWGAADGTIFAIDAISLKVVKSKLIFPSEYSTTHLRPYFLRWSPDGLLFAALARKLVVIDPDTLEHAVLEEELLPLMTLGPEGHVYYNDDSQLMIRKRLT